MTIWSTEIKDLEKVFDSLTGSHPKLEKELEKLVKTDDENMVLVYARRCLEVIVTDLSERELNRPRGTEPLKGIIDKLNREGKVPENIITSMQNLNSLSTFGAHPKDFDPRQVKPVILDLITIIDWYQKCVESRDKGEAMQGKTTGEKKGTLSQGKKSRKLKRVIYLISGILLGSIVIVILLTFNIIGGVKKAKAGAIESVVVLPFDNYTGDNQLDYFVSGMHSSLIGEMGKVGGLRTIGKTSSIIYKDINKSVPEIASELDVDAVIEADVRCIGDSICLQVRLISAGPEEKQLWVGDYKEEKSRILDLYDQITKKIAEEVKVNLTPREKALLSETKTLNTDAYDAYLKGMYYWDQFTPESLQQALEYFNKAIEIDPDWAPPHAGIAYYWIALRQFGLAPATVTIPNIYENLNKAFQLDPNSPNTLYVSALASVWTGFAWEKGEKEFLKVLDINPNDAFAHVYYGHLLMILKRDKEAISQASLALNLDPLNPMIQSLYAMVMAYTGDYNKAIEVGNKALSLAPGNGVALSAVSIAYLNKGDYKKSFDAWMGYLPFDETVKQAILNTLEADGYASAAIRFAEELEKTGFLPPMELVQAYAIAGEHSKAMDWLEKAYEDRDANAPYAGLNWFKNGPLKINDPRLDELLKKMNLPL
jgi:TolB-like protein/Flp pilus assembly protein TadD